MALSDAELDAIEGLLAAAAPAETAIPALRERLPGLSVTRCDASDVDAETPFRVWPHVSLFLVDAADHCWRLTSDPARATGIVVAAARKRAA